MSEIEGTTKECFCGQDFYTETHHRMFDYPALSLYKFSTTCQIVFVEHEKIKLA